MKCAKCGTEFNEGIFCPECGTKYDEEEAKKAEALRVEEENKQRELELEKAKAEAERLAKERAEQEAELLRQQNENARIQQALEAKKSAEESRTFNGVLYSTVEEKENARQKYETEQVELKKKKSADSDAKVCLVLALLSLLFSVVTAIPSIRVGVRALKRGTEKKSMVIISFVIDGLLILLAVWVLFGSGSNNGSQTSNKTSSEVVIEDSDMDLEEQKNAETENTVADQPTDGSEESNVAETPTPTPTEAPTPTPTKAPTPTPTDKPTPTAVTLDTSICGKYDYLDAYWDEEWGRAVHEGYGCIEVYTDGTDLYADMYYILDPAGSGELVEQRSGKLTPTGKKGEYSTCGGEVILYFNDDAVTLMYNMASGEMDHEYLRTYD